MGFKIKRRVRIKKIPKHEKGIKRKSKVRRQINYHEKPKKVWDQTLLISIFDLVSRGVPADDVPKQLRIAPKRWKRWLREIPEIKRIIKRANSVVFKPNTTRYNDYNLTPTQRRFLIAYERCGTVVDACKVLGIAVANHSMWKSEKADSYNKDYAEAFAFAERIANDRIEAEISNRAIGGLRRYKFYNGMPLLIDCAKNDPEGFVIHTKRGDRYVKHYYEIEKSDTLLMFLAKRRMPEYREKQTVEHKHEGTILMDLVSKAEAGRKVDVIDVEYIQKAADGQARRIQDQSELLEATLSD